MMMMMMMMMMILPVKPGICVTGIGVGVVAAEIITGIGILKQKEKKQQLNIINTL
jgi:hypothetical protein